MLTTGVVKLAKAAKSNVTSVLQTHTCAYEHHVVLIAICGLHLVNYDACEFSSPSHQ